MNTVFTRLLVLVVLAGFSTAQAYSTIAERILNVYLSSPLDLVPLSTTHADSQINLLKWNENPQDPPAPQEHYNRLKHFGTWIVLNQGSNDCVDVRGRVLIRDSLSPVTMRAEDPCRVGSGTWHDPYTNKDFQSAADVQIDHFVPLKDVYINGAWKWNYQQRCTYANYMGYHEHLKVVSGPENQFKSDHSPENYMPPYQPYKCEYLRNWLSIKLIWKLGMQRSEAIAIKQLIEQERCNPSDFVFSSAELRNQRATITKLLPFCPDTAPAPVRYNPTIPGTHQE